MGDVSRSYGICGVYCTRARVVKLDEDFKAGRIGRDEYVERRQSLKQTKTSLNEELHRMGVVT